MEDEDEEIVRTMEVELLGWYGDARNQLNNDTRIAGLCDYGLVHIIDELAYWENRHLDLKLVVATLKNRRVSETVSRLRQSDSAVVKLYETIVDQLQHAVAVAVSNMHYLQILKGPCMDLYGVTMLKEIETMVSDIFLKFLFILDESPYYNQLLHYDNLCEFLGNQIIFVCRKTMDTATLLDDDPMPILGSALACVRCCQFFLVEYKEVVSCYNQNVQDGERMWLRARNTFVFVQRCMDIIYLIKAKIIFKRIAVHRMTVPKPKFLLAPGLRFEKAVEKNEDDFDSVINALRKPLVTIHDVLNTDWPNQMKQFQGELFQLCSRTQVIIDEAFYNSTNHVDAMDTLQYFLYLADWPQLGVFFRQKIEVLFTLIFQHLESMLQAFTKNRHDISTLMAPYSGACVMATIQLGRLKELRLSISKRKWLTEYAVYEQFLNVCDDHMAKKKRAISTTFEAWWHQINPDIEAQLEKHILRVRETSKDLWKFTPDIDNIATDMMKEVEGWKLIPIGMPIMYSDFTRVVPNLIMLLRYTTSVVKHYNFIIEGLSAQELQLFSQIIKTCVQEVVPLVRTFTWSQAVKACKFTIDCISALQSVQDIVDDYKHCNQEIVNTCNKIANAPLFDVNSKQEMIDLKENVGSISIIPTVNDIIKRYNDIIRYVTVVYEGFEKHIKRMTTSWEIYVKKIDQLVQKSLIFNVQWSMENILSQREKPLFMISVSLNDTEIVYTPRLLNLVVYSTTLLLDMATALKPVPRLCYTFKLSYENLLPYSYAVLHDPACVNLQSEIDISTRDMLSLIKNYVTHISVYADIWTVDKHKYFMEFEAGKRTADVFDLKMTKYEDNMKSVKLMKAEETLSCAIVRIDIVKQQIKKHCLDWISRFSQLLVYDTTDLVDGVYEYMKFNGKRVMLPPDNLIEMDEYINFQKQLVIECSEKLQEIDLINDNVAVLKKHEIDMSVVLKDKLDRLSDSWKDYKELLEEAEIMLKEKQAEFEIMVLGNQDKFLEDVKQFWKIWNDYKEKSAVNAKLRAKSSLYEIERLRELYKEMKAKEMRLIKDLALFNLSLVKPKETDIRNEIEFFFQAVSTIGQWDSAWESYKTGNFWETKVTQWEILVQSLFKKISGYIKTLKDKTWKMFEIARDSVDAFRRVLPLITNLKNPAMQTRHWDEVRGVMNKQFDQTDPGFTLELIMEMQMQKYENQIYEISNKATMEMNIENSIKMIEETWTTMNLTVEPYKEEGVYVVKASDEILQTLEEHIVQLYAMKGSKYISQFIKKADYWEKGLALVTEVLELTLSVQRQYNYAENIFKGEDVRISIPNETEAYEQLTVMWKSITKKMYAEKNVFKACYSKSLLKRLRAMNERLGEIQRALETYMETKRNIFPRFYFISNDDLLDILVHAKDPKSLQPHFKKCFDNINKLEFTADNEFAKGMHSADGEYVPWITDVQCTGPVEIWFTDIETNMRSTLRKVFRDVMSSLRKNLKTRDEWILKWPGQLCITAAQIQWTVNCTVALLRAKAAESRRPLKKIRKRQKKMLAKFSDAIRGNLKKIDRLKIVSLVTIEIHARDVIDKMYKMNCMDVSDFEWMSQLRFYWDKKEPREIRIRQTNTEQVYGFEYLGNSGRLVITPLTDRCYITLTTALHLFRGGSPKGPAGTGKTETVKDLGKNLAYYVIVINCSDGLDYKSMGRMFSGLAQQGAWGCFDEFNRINIEVLSVVAQQILSIYSALAAGKRHFTFEGNVIGLIPTCGIFITMNPGYAGRTELPDNLKSMFRAISMVVPDTKLIAEITLFGEGFRDTRNLANKVFVLFSLCKQQLSKQDHYEFGLRGLVALLRYAGQCRRQYSKMADDEVLLLAMHNMNLAKLTVDDLPLFMGITNDLFPSIKLPEVKNDVLIDAIKRCMAKKNHQPSDSAIAKIVQLYETKVSRHSVMVLGKTGAAKTSTWKTLRDSMAVLKKENVESFEMVIVYPLNPKTLTLGELYGEFNTATQEWMDGVLSSTMRKTCSDPSVEQKWLLFDGPVDAVWIENMNSVMDDNKVLTLINSERITMPEQVSLLFEVEDLAVASPATVSRCGIVYNDYKDFGWKLFFVSWLNTCSFEPYRENIEYNFYKYIDNILDFKKANCVETIPLPELSSIQSLCKLLECFTFSDLATQVPTGLQEGEYEFLIKIWFLYCMVWSVCAVVNEDGRKKIDTYLRDMERVFPVRDTVYHYYVDTKTCQFRHWENLLRNNTWKYNEEMPFFKIIVPTIDTIRYNYLVEAFMQKKQPVLLVGPVGTGKTSTVQKALDGLNKNKFLLLTINMSAQTSAHNVQETIEGRLEKRTKDLYVPQANKTLVTFLDDMNMPEKEVYGAQPPLELIRQWIDYGFWFDRQYRFLKNVKNMLLIGAMGPPGGGRNTVSNRFISCFSVVNLTFPEEPQIASIYRTMLSQHLEAFDETIQDMRTGLTEMTITLYKSVVANLLPTPAKMHYLFNMRDISKVFQGLLRSNIANHSVPEAMLRLWCNEVLRVFNDKLIEKKDREWFMDQINVQLGKHYLQTFRNLCSSDRTLMFCDFLNKQALYEEVLNEKLLQETVYEKLDEYNASPGVVPMNLVLFKDAIDHICRITRVISQPKGYILLIGIGGSGRSSLARLSNWICDYKFFTIELTKTYGTSDFKEDIKQLYYLTGVKDQPTSFLFNDTQIAYEAFLEIINNILSTGEVPKLYKNEEFDEIKDLLLDSAKREGVLETTDAIYSFFLDRIRSNLHVILCMSPIGNQFRVRLRQYPSLVNCTTIDWFLDWPKEALLEVAAKSLTTLEVLETITGMPRIYDVDVVSLTEKELKFNIANMFAIIHHSVVEYSNIMILELKRYNYVTPTNYLELVSGYKETLRMKRLEVANVANKLRNGLFKIDETSAKVAIMTIDLERATATVVRYTRECDEFLHEISEQTAITDRQKREVDEKSFKIKKEEIECRKLYSAAVADLDLAMPALEDAMEALNALNKKDLAEVKSFSKPPERVKLVLEAVMILKQCEPTWAETKKQLGDPNFLTQLRYFDKDHIPPKVLRKINTYTRNPEFEPEKVGAQSIAAKSLAKWVIAIEKYALIYKIVMPKKKSADEALASLEEKQAALFAEQKLLAELQELLLNLNADFAEKMEEKDRLIKSAENLKWNLERAASLIEGLSGEKIRWTESVEQLDIDFDYLPGDCLLSIAFVSYIGPFVFKYRDSMLKLWTSAVREMQIPNNPKYEVKAFLSDPAVIRNWNIHGLPNDDLSTENGIIISRGSRWPLVIDPQCQAVKWIKNMEAENNLTLVDFCMPDFNKILETALQHGYPTLLQITSDTLDPAVMPVLSKSIVKKGDELYIKMGDKMLPYHVHFRFFITTKIRNPHYSPEIFTRSTVVNFAIKQEGLEDQLLDAVIRMEKPELKTLKDDLIINIDKGKKKLIELEDELLRLLNESEGSLLENEDLFETLITSKITSAKVNEELESSLITQAEIVIAREAYRVCAKRASILFFVLNELSQIDPMYQFSLDSYVDLFENSIKKSKKDKLLVVRLSNLNDYHTYAVYQNTCRGLFEVHKLLFSFQITVSLMMADGEIPGNELEFLLKGGIVLDKEQQTDNPCSSWLPSSNWDNITELDKLPGFGGVEMSFSQYPDQWREWYMSSKPETLRLIANWDGDCNAFQKMLFVRCLRLDRLSFTIANFISERFGSKFIEPPVMDLKSALDDSSNKTPLIFLLSPGVDPTSMLTGLVKNSDTELHSLSLGQGQAPIATQLIEKGQESGAWVFLANCHLSLSWMPQLDKIVDVMQDGQSNPQFRLWLSSDPNPDFPISILQSAIKMTTEPPKGIKANMKRLYNNMTDEKFDKCKAHEKYKKLLFSLCFFHSVLIERKKFQNLGWNVVYSFNDSDFEISENLLSIYLDEYTDTPWNALKYLIAGICYGGHVTDEWDRRLLDTYINQYYNENVITTPYYKLSSSLSYYNLRDGDDLPSYRQYIEQLPIVDSPEAFGQHSNAEMASLMGVNLRACYTLMVLQGQSTTVVENKEEKVLVLASEILRKIPEKIDYEATAKNIGLNKSPMEVVLLQEILRYNKLLGEIKLSLIGLEKGIKGLVVMSSDLEEVFQCINDGKVPGQWLKAYLSLMPLGSWTLDLIERVDHFKVWANELHPPVIYWLGAYTYPTGFLTAVLQIHSRSSTIPIDLLHWDFAPAVLPELDETDGTGENETIIIEPPQDGVYVRRLYLEGANWDMENSCLCEPVPLQFISDLPIMHFKPVQTTARKKAIYQCPVYYYSQRCGAQGRDAFVVIMGLNSGSEMPDHWIKRATAILLNLST